MRTYEYLKITENHITFQNIENMCIYICQEKVQVMRENWQTSVVRKKIKKHSGSYISGEVIDTGNNNIMGAINV